MAVDTECKNSRFDDMIESEKPTGPIYARRWSRQILFFYVFYFFRLTNSCVNWITTTVGAID